MYNVLNFKHKTLQAYCAARLYTGFGANFKASNTIYVCAYNSFWLVRNHLHNANVFYLIFGILVVCEI